jgi:hypothetical protein
MATYRTNADDKDTSEEVQRLLLELCECADDEDRAVRERQIRQWRKLKFFWDGFTQLWWSDVAHDWRTPDSSYDSSQYDASWYDKPVNIFRAYLESIIAALSVTIPPVKCFPDDAESALDLTTAKGGDKIAELLYKHNDAPLLWLHGLYIYCTEGLVAAYSYPKEDEAYGTYEEKQYEDEEQTEMVKVCPMCQQNMVNEDLVDQAKDEFQPDDEDAPLHDILINENMKICPNCMTLVNPELREQKFIVEKLVGITKKPKSRQCIEVYGGLFVKIPIYAKRQADIPYLRLSYECAYSTVVERYPFLRNKFGKSQPVNATSDPYERWGRLSTQYLNEWPINTPTVSNYWLRPCHYYNLKDDKDIEKLKKKYPDGCKVVKINDCFAKACNEALDDCWTLTHNPLSDYLHHQPLGSSLVPVQEVTNELISLTLQTIEHGIPQTFFDTQTLDADAYNNMEATPGALVPARAPTGKTLSDGFFQVKTAILSGEVETFAQRMQESGQLVSGALPSLFGGAMPASSKTASQYAMSRAQALQRLQTTWKVFTFWWKGIFAKSITSFIKDMVEDEKFVQRDASTGGFINVFIKRSELEGKIGNIELEASEQMPITWAQRRDIIMQILQGGNPLLMEMFSTPENLPLIKEALGLTELEIPGDEDRQKQYDEIRMLVDSEPVMVGPGIEFPSVMIDEIVDNHKIQADICRNWLISEAGRICKLEKPAGYKNVLLHLQAHIMAMQPVMPQQPEQPEEQSPKQGKKPEPGPQQPKEQEQVANQKPVAQPVKQNVGITG